MQCMVVGKRCLLSASLQPVVSFRIQWVKIPTPTLRPGITHFCQPEPTLPSFWDGTSFYIHCRCNNILLNLQDSFTTFEKQEVPGYFLFLCFLFLWVASCLLRVSGLFPSTVKTIAITPIPSLWCVWGGSQITKGFHVNARRTQ